MSDTSGVVLPQTMASLRIDPSAVPTDAERLAAIEAKVDQLLRLTLALAEHLGGPRTLQASFREFERTVRAKGAGL
jgi:hypothetical protein